jgi:hypothetical protein
MNMKLTMMLGFAFLVNAAFAETITVPGKANPWLAGMTNGSTGRRGDIAPDESPVSVTATLIQAGATYTFSASGSANHGAPNASFPPNGEELISHYLGAENGIADIIAPFDSLVGVFLGPDQPDQYLPPPPLDFRDKAERDYLVLAPSLKQPFFIGYGVTTSNAVQQIIAPNGATRLFLGIMDQYSWYDNEGSFSVQVAQSAPPSAIHLGLHPSANPGRRDAAPNPATPVVTPTAPAALPDNSPATTLTSALNNASAPTVLELRAYTAIEISWPSENNHSYQLQWSASLDSPQWASLGPVIPGSGVEMSIFDSTRTHPQGFYRVRIVQ